MALLTAKRHIRLKQSMKVVATVFAHPQRYLLSTIIGYISSSTTLNIYAHSREECKALLAEMIQRTKAEIAAEKERLRSEKSKLTKDPPEQTSSGGQIFLSVAGYVVKLKLAFSKAPNKLRKVKESQPFPKKRLTLMGPLGGFEPPASSLPIRPENFFRAFLLIFNYFLSVSITL